MMLYWKGDLVTIVTKGDARPRFGFFGFEFSERIDETLSETHGLPQGSKHALVPSLTLKVPTTKYCTH